MMDRITGLTKDEQLYLDAEEIRKSFQPAYDKLFHAVCGMSCVYAESKPIKMNCCDWSKLIDEFDRINKMIADLCECSREVIDTTPVQA